MNEDGTLDRAELPERMGVVDGDGRPKVDSDGTPVYIDPRELFGPPPLGPGIPDPNQRSVISVDEWGEVTETVILED